MILRLSDSLSRGLIVVAAMCVAVVLCFFALRMAGAANAASEESLSGLKQATRLEPKNPEYWYQLGHFQQFNLEQPDSVAAEEYFKKAIALDPGYTDAWLDLGTAYELDGNLEAAKDAYASAKKSYPASAEVSWRYGNFLLRQGDSEAAFPEFRRSLDLDPRRAAAAFSRCYRANPNVEEILDKVLPPTPSAFIDVIAETAAAKQISTAELVWKRLLTLHPHLTVQAFEPIVAGLLSEHEYAEARRIWSEGTEAMYLPPLLAHPSSVIWDASFESGVSSGSFAWHFQPLAQGVTTAFDAAEKLSGNQSLRITFDGKHNPYIEAACALAVVIPQTKYRFSAWIKTNELTTDHGVGFRIHSHTSTSEDPLVRTRELTGTNTWTFVEAPYTTGPDVHKALVCLGRDKNLETDVRMAGSAWIDDVNLVPEITQPVKP